MKLDNAGSSDVIQRFIASEANEKRKISHKILSEIKNVSELEQRKKHVREKLIEALGGLPGRVPVNALCVSKTKKSCYTVENIILEAETGVDINLNLYIPNSNKKVFPAVVFAAGHLPKTDSMHQYPVLELAKKGYISACFDCLGRGERTSGNEHFTAGVLSWMNGRCMNRYFIHDSMQVVDYLLTRSDVESGKIACAGASGGGNTSIYHAALDERISCAVSVCTISSFTDLINFQYSGCPEYYPPGLLGMGIDIQDIASLISPRPQLLIGGGCDELNSIESLKETYAYLKKAYSFYGENDKVSMYVDDSGKHGCNLLMRRAMYDFLDKYLLPDEKTNNGNIKEEDTATEDPAVLNFAKPCGRSIISYEYAAMQKGRIVDEKQKIRTVLGINKDIKWNVVSEATEKTDNLFISNVSLMTDNGVVIPVTVAGHISGVYRKTILRLGDISSMTEVNDGELIVCAEVRGSGSLKLKPTKWDFLNYCSADRAVSSGAIVLGYPIIGQQVFDCLCVLDYVCKRYNAGMKLEISAEGLCSYAAVILARVTDFEVGVVNADKISFLEPFENCMAHPDADISLEEQICLYQTVIPGIIDTKPKAEKQ
ncbi:MAG: acetylxylan esterase [Clostridia bacterium]|nr:acetylxylan esterase [Clostridia bacterium]